MGGFTNPAVTTQYYDTATVTTKYYGPVGGDGGPGPAKENSIGSNMAGAANLSISVNEAFSNNPHLPKGGLAGAAIGAVGIAADQASDGSVTTKDIFEGIGSFLCGLAGGAAGGAAGAATGVGIGAVAGGYLGGELGSKVCGAIAVELHDALGYRDGPVEITYNYLDGSKTVEKTEIVGQGGSVGKFTNVINITIKQYDKHGKLVLQKVYRDEIDVSLREYHNIDELFADRCFAAGTLISMADGSKKPIEQIRRNDWVLSPDKDGTLQPGRVVRTFQNRSKEILDVFGLMITPGHVTLCGDGRFDGRYVPVLDILRSDGALVMEDGSKVRAGTGCALGTLGDRFIHAVIGETQKNGMMKVSETGLIRLGTRFMTADGEDISVMDLIFANGGLVTEDGYIKTGVSGEKLPFRWTFTAELPKPEDYVLQRSQTTLQRIYRANEWEGVSPQMPDPAYVETGARAPGLKPERRTVSVSEPLSSRTRSGAPKGCDKKKKVSGLVKRRSSRENAAVH
ncbi:hypothetical protein [Pelagibius sp.]|uniref:hypothetical protein n=1 Tax=Pelagibius sp. TaxID=1931238 RepID=UPI00260668EE|nr:hypothetical protein [Pelagibius sp.]